MRWRRVILGVWIIASVLATVVTAHSQDEPWIGKIVSIQGRILVKRSGETQWKPARLNDTLGMDDSVRVGSESRAAIALKNESLLRLDQNTTLSFNGMEEKKTFLLELLKGAGHFFSRRPQSLKVITPFVNGVVKGTEFLVRVDPEQSGIFLFDGRVLAENARGSLLLAKGQTAIARADQAPRLEIVARPRDAVQWALYYPPILAFSMEEFAGSDDWQAGVRRSIQAADQGDLEQAFAAIAGLGPGIADPRFFAFRAGLNLNVGRTGEATNDIEHALTLDDKNSRALALRAIMAVVQNRRDDAEADARLATASDPESAAARIALSYALQARFDLDAALEQARIAARKSPENAAVWARLAELQLSTGELDDALSAAERSARLNPRLAHSRTILGFAYLTQIKIPSARQAFEEAIDLDSAAPLPRLGLGLAKIHAGDLEAGRAEIEIAAGLDPDNSLIRSYLGKAFFDEKRGPLDAHQFEIAKELDPNDPTPWFYDAIRKQTENRPVEALHDLQKSIALNDNRAVYRSRLLLDQDLAARSASLGRIYKDLGFQELALRQGWQSLSVDPADYAAHRLLADSYSSRPRHEIARVSELLQSQLLQPLNITPIQPQLAESNIKILEGAGPGSTSFNEQNVLTTKNCVSLQTGGVAGGNASLGDEVSLSGIYNRFSLNLGQFHYETDGFRENNDLDQDIYDLFMQTALTYKLNLQAEFRRKDVEQGDLLTYFDNAFDPVYRKNEKTDTQRLGLHYQATQNSDFILSLIRLKTQENTLYLINEEYEEYNDEFRGYSVEGQYLYDRPIFSAIAGLSRYGVDNDLDGMGLFEVINYNHYLYFHFNYPNTFNWTLGASYTVLDDDIFVRSIEEFNPKLGLVWHPIVGTELRAAYTRGLKRNLIADQTIEPTQVAGFNQFYDDFNGTFFRLYGMAIDQKVGENVYLGIEYNQRQLNVPIPLSPGILVEKEHWEENLYRTYLYLTFLHVFAFKAEYSFEFFDRDMSVLSVTTPLKMDTQSVPLSFTYFNPWGYYLRLNHTFVNQEVTVASGAHGSDAFLVADISFGYRFPNRYGDIVLSIMNIFDKRFNYQGIESIRTPQNTVDSIFAPERLFTLRLNISF